MASKEQVHSNDNARLQTTQPAAQHGEIAEQQTDPGTIIQRARSDPRSLSQQDVLQLQRTVGNRAVGRILGQITQHQPVQRSENSTGIPDKLKAGVENLSGLSMDDVKVHYNSHQPAQIQALAYAQGTDIHVGPGQKQHLPHEAWHVVQQKQGRVKPTIRANGVSLNDETGLEHEATVMGAKALQMTYSAGTATGSTQSAGALLQQAAETNGQSVYTIQRISKFSKWFIKKILIPILLEIMGENKDLPAGFVQALAALDRFLKIDDTGREDWAVALGALNFFFEQIESNEPDTIALACIIIDNIATQIIPALKEAEFEVANYKQLLNYLAPLRMSLMSPLSEEDAGSSSEEDTPQGLEELFEAYPKITDPLRRPGHLNPYRHGIGAADTIAILSVNRKRLIARIAGDEPRKIVKIEKLFMDLDQNIKAINDKKEKPILNKIIELTIQKNKLIDTSSEVEVDTSEIDKAIGNLEAKLLTIRDDEKKTHREKLRKLYEQVFWISQKSDDDVDEAARARQVKELFNLTNEAGFDISYTKADESPDDYFSKEDGEPPTLTAHHSEQRVIVSKHWIHIRSTICSSILAAMKQSQNIEAAIDLLTPIVTTMSLNRSSCYMCNAFLVADLISLWKEVVGLLGYKGSWQQIRDALKNIFVFEVTYSVPYSKVGNIDELNKQLLMAGWHVSAHEETEASQDEAEHEKLSLGNIVSSDVKKEKKARRRSNKQEDEDYEEHVKAQPSLISTTRLSRQVKLEDALRKFFKQLITKQGSNALDILQELGFQHHDMKGDDLNCALYSIQHQLAVKYNVHIADFEEFSTYVRKQAGLRFMKMIDVLNNGKRVLDAVVAYLVSKGIIAPNSTALTLNIWSAVVNGGVMQFDGVAQSTRAAKTYALTLYYNGVNHFDSLTGGPEL